MSNQVEQAQVGKIRVFALGGTGINIVSALEASREHTDPGMAHLDIVYADTSVASIPANIDRKHFYKLENPNAEIDGSGGERAHNAEEIAASHLEILHKFPAHELSIVVSSTSGGSGSVLANTIVSELLSQDKQVIVLAVGADDTKQYIKNTINTLVSYENIARNNERPVIMHYTQNGEAGMSIEQVNKRIRQVISALAMLFSRQNGNLDSRDLYNFLNFHNVTTFQPQVGVLSVNYGKLDIGDEQLISLATLSTSMDNTRVDQLVEYQRVGIVKSFTADGNSEKDDQPIHFAVTDGFLDGVVRKMRKRLAQFEETAAQRKVLNNLGTGKETANKRGLVL